VIWPAPRPCLSRIFPEGQVHMILNRRFKARREANEHTSTAGSRGRSSGLERGTGGRSGGGAWAALASIRGGHLGELRRIVINEINCINYNV
jgi:hypothetical protein